MRPPPPLVVDGQPSTLWRVGCALLTAAAGAAFAAWLAAHAELAAPLQALAASLAALAAAAVGVRLAGRAGPVRVAWDGAAWYVDGAGGDLQLMLDLGPPLLLLRHRRSGAGARWVAVSAARGTGDLHALRVGLYSRPPKGTPVTSAVRAPDRATD
jgi:hypothetical protein